MTPIGLSEIARANLQIFASVLASSGTTFDFCHQEITDTVNALIKLDAAIIVYHKQVNS